MIPSSQKNASVFNATMLKFGAPQTIIRQYDHWTVLLRPQQLTLGSLILAAHDPARAFSQLSPESFIELHEVTSQLEAALARAFHYDKLNYLMLMMIDPDVHFHVLPRYSETRKFEGTGFSDSGWPGAPDLGRRCAVNPEINRHIINHIVSCWA
jgi:diadenosine tetraphosphate (Ap4A) HIT family hydrolase